MGSTAFWIGGLLLLGLAGVLGYGLYPPLSAMVAQNFGGAAGLAPVALGLLGLACCGLGFIFNSDA